MTDHVVNADPIFFHQLGHKPYKTFLRLRGKIPLIRITAGLLHRSIGIADTAFDSDGIIVRADPMERVSTRTLQTTATMPDNSSLRISCLIDRTITLDIVVPAVTSAVQIRIIRIWHAQDMDYDELDLIRSSARWDLRQVLLRNVMNPV